MENQGGEKVKVSWVHSNILEHKYDDGDDDDVVAANNVRTLELSHKFYRMPSVNKILLHFSLFITSLCYVWMLLFDSESQREYYQEKIEFLFVSRNLQ